MSKQQLPQYLIDLPSHHNIILFDGICAVCNKFVNFVIDHDQHKIFKFTSLQSNIGNQLKQLHNINPEIDSMILITNRNDNNKLGQSYIRSTAAIMCISMLDGYYSYANYLLYIPSIIRDTSYKCFANIRYVLFGTVDRCRYPTQDIKTRFLDDTTFITNNNHNSNNNNNKTD